MKKTILIIKKPENQHIYKENRYIKVDDKTAEDLISGGYGVEYDPKTKKKITPDDDHQEEINESSDQEIESESTEKKDNGKE